MKKYLILALIIIFIITTTIITYNYKSFGNNEIFYKLNQYIYLDFKEDIFYYYYNNTEYLEEDYILEIKHNDWKFLYYNEDLYIREKDYNEAKEYYDNDSNYKFYINIEEEYNSTTIPLTITKDELHHIYNMQNIIKKDSIKFENIETLGSLTKVSKDQKVTGIISLAYYKNNWYYKTEIMNEKDEEYIIKLPDSLNQRIKDINNN